MIHRVLVPTDFSELSARALRFVRDSFPDSQIHVIYALDGVAREHGSNEACFEMLADEASIPPIKREPIKRCDSDLRNRLERFVRHACNTKNVTTSSVFGDVVNVILEAARYWQADLIYMGTHDDHSLERLFYGSVAEAVIQRAQIPVLIHKEANSSSTGSSLRRARRYDREVREMRLS